MLKDQLKERKSYSPRGAHRKRDDGPVPAYSLMSEKLRRSSSGSVQCSLFCGGQSCKYESPLQWRSEDMALRGLYSHWVTDNVLAMARPSTILFRIYDIIGQFKSVGVSSVINLQCAWEHSKCGPGLEDSGFTYQPQHLMSEGVYYYNFGWSDYSVPSLETLLDAVKVLDYSLTIGKAAVHCHAGLGRTGLLIACHMIYSTRTPANAAIGHVRVKRPGSIQTRSQIEIVQRFGNHLSTLWTFHPSLELYSNKGLEVNRLSIENGASDNVQSKRSKVDNDGANFAECVESSCDTRLTFDDLLKNQAQVLHGEMQVDLKQIPKVVHDVCARISERSHDPGCDVILHFVLGGSCQANPVIFNCLQVCCYDDHLDADILDPIHAIKAEMNSSLDWSLLRGETDLRVLLGLLATFFSSLKTPFMAPQDVSLIDSTHKLTSLAPSQLHTITRLMSTLKALITQQLHCDSHDCLAGILTEVFQRLAGLFLQLEERNGLEFNTIVATVLVEHCLMH